MARKRHYRISEISRITGVEPHVLRYWEREFKRIRPRRVRNQRLYRDQDLALIQEIKRLLHDEGYTISGARRRLEAYYRGSVDQDRTQDPVVEIKEGLLELYELLSR